MSDKPVKIPDLVKMKANGERIVMLSVYDYVFARLFDQAGVDLLLVGDSVGPVVAGLPSTVPVTMDQMVYHTSMVARGARRALVVADLPFLSYEASLTDAVYNAGRLLKEGGAGAVKLEGGKEVAPVVRKLVDVGIPVIGHCGLEPQSVHVLGSYRVHGKTEAEAERLLEDCLALQEAGAAAIVLELVTADVARHISQELVIPTIGIGSGPDCDGQVLVGHDALGLLEDFHPKFVKRYVELAPVVKEAVAKYVADVRSRKFPDEEHSH